MPVTIRPATAADYKNVIALYADFVNQPDRYKKLDADSYHEALKQPNFWFYLAEDNRQIIGFITFSKRWVVRYPKPIIEVEEFFVSPEKRRQGIGTLLMDQVLAIAQKEDSQYVFLASSKDRLPAHQFYKSMNFDKYAFHYRRKPKLDSS
jgi:(aminoalkyl)phosphonate N-acetyltransferase